MIPRDRDTLERLLRVFPRTIVDGKTALHECPECQTLREHLAGIAWPEIPAEFVRDRPDVLPLLTHEAYLAFLPAWLHRAAIEPDDEVAAMLLVNLETDPDITGFTVEQRKAVIAIARLIVRRGYWGSGDVENIKSIAAIERIWSADP